MSFDHLILLLIFALRAKIIGLRPPKSILVLVIFVVVSYDHKGRKADVRKSDTNVYHSVNL